MRRLSRVLLLTGVTFVAIAALLASGLCLVLPHLNSWRPTILGKTESAIGLPVSTSQFFASWQNFGPTPEARNIHVQLEDGKGFSVKRVMSALDVWRSLLHMHWQFHDLTFW